MKKIFLYSSAVCIALLSPLFVFAHEVYVLSSEQIRTGLHTDTFSPLIVIAHNLHQFIFWAIVSIVAATVVFYISILRVFEKALDPILAKAKFYAPTVARITVGISFIAMAHYGAIFGPELPLTNVFGQYDSTVTALLFGLGILITVGWYTRFTVLVALFLFGFVIFKYGWYTLTYIDYYGALVALFIIGTHRFGFDRFRRSHAFLRKTFSHPEEKLVALSFFILRVSFGASLLYASLYAKFFHNGLALQVANIPLAGHAHTLAYYFGMDPQFLVLGAGIIEVVAALFFIFGIEIRFTALFLEFWLALSLWYFGESVWPHLILIGIPIAFILYGYDRYSLEGFFFKKGKREPVL